MKFNYQKEKAKFLADWAREEAFMRLHNASEQFIAEMYEFSLNQFRADRNYYLHKDELSSESDLSEDIDLEANLSFLDTVENPVLLGKLKELTRDEVDIIKMYYVENLSLLEISDVLGEKYSAVQQRLYRLKNKLKK